MDKNTLITIGVSLITSFLTAVGMISHKMGRYTEKVDQLEHCNLNTRLSTLEGRYSVSSITQNKSPITLTETGSKLLKESSADVFVDKNYDELLKKVQDHKTPLSAYDVQEKCKEVIASYKGDDRFVPLKDFAFKQGIELNLIQIVASIYLRDKVLPSFGFTQKDVDKTTPVQATKATQ